MNRNAVLALLKSRGIPFELAEHRAVYNMADLAEIVLPHPEADAKNLFVRDDKRRSYYLITVRGEKRVNLKAFRHAHGTRPLSFASDEELAALLALTAGSVTPLGLLNDETRRVALFIDEELLEGDGLIAVHPNDNTATVWLKTADLIALLREQGHSVETTQL